MSNRATGVHMRGGWGATRRLRVAAVLSVSLTAVASGLVARPAGAQLPSNSTLLPGTMAVMVVDAATNHVFVSVPKANDVVVLDFDGTIVATIKGEAGANGLALVGSSLYVAASTAGAIDEIDTATLARTRTLATGLTGLQSLAYAAGALWIVEPANGLGSLVRVSPSDGAATTVSRSPFYDDPSVLRSDPADANTLFAYTTNGEPGFIARLDLSTDPPTVAATARAPGNYTVRDFAPSPDGTDLYTAGDQETLDVIHASNLLPTGLTYHTDEFTSAVALTPAAGGMLAAGSAGNSRSDVLVFRTSDPHQLLASQDFPSGPGYQGVEDDGMAFSPDGARLFVVTGGDGFGGPELFHVLAISGPPPPFKRITAIPSSLIFGLQRVGTYGASKTLTIENTGTEPVTVSELSFRALGAATIDYFGDTDCFPTAHARVLAAGAVCHVSLAFAPIGLGPDDASLLIHDDAPASPQVVPLLGTGSEGYLLADSRGEVAPFGDAVFHGSIAGAALAAPVISIRTTANGAGYWLLGRDGGVFSFGNAAFYGSTGAMHLNQPIISMTPTPTGRGYWLIAADGGIFSYGDAKFYGSTGNLRLAQPIVAMAATPTGRGYWLVAADGGIFSYGDAKFYGSTGNLRLAQPIVGMIASPTGRGYTFVAVDGGIFTFGDAKFFGSAAGSGSHIVGIAPTPTGRGYWLTSRTGAIYPYGDAPFYGDTRLEGVFDVVGIAATAPPLPPDLLDGATPHPISANRPLSSNVAQRLVTGR